MRTDTIIKSIIFTAVKISLLIGETSVMAGETSPMLTDPDINSAYKNCKLFEFKNENDKMLSSDVSHFYNLPETYWNQGIHDQCVATLQSETLAPSLSSGPHQGEKFTYIKILRRMYLPSTRFCDGRSDYDECLKKYVFKFYGFHETGHDVWKRRVYDPDKLEKSMSETVHGTIFNSDGITVFSEWTPRNYDGMPSGDFTFFVIVRQTPFGYIVAGNDGVAIPIDGTKESRARVSELISRITSVVQSVRMKKGE
jgi:hypothetical protein